MSLNQENHDLVRHTFLAGVFFIVVLIVGTLGYAAIEDWSIFDAFYMTVITLATIGYGETHPLTAAGRWFTIGLIFLGVGYLGYAFGGITRFFATGGMREFRRRQHMENLRRSLHNHVIVCGGGRLGTSIVESLREKHQHIVVVDRDPHVAGRFSEGVQVLPIAGDATEDEVLKEAGVERADVLVAALNDDAANVFLTLSARGLNPRLKIFAKADDPATIAKLRRAGCDHPFSPGMVTGHRIAAQILRPTVTQILSLAREDRSVELSIEELQASRLGVKGPTRMVELGVWGTGKLLILAVHRPDGSVVFPPTVETVVEPPDQIVVMGTPESIQAIVRIPARG